MEQMTWIRPVLRRAKKVWIYEEHKGWGDNFSIEKDSYKDDTARMHGHCHGLLEGDELRFNSATRPGMVIICRILDLEYCENPRDMFFCKIHMVTDLVTLKEKFFEDGYGLTRWERFKAELRGEMPAQGLAAGILSLLEIYLIGKGRVRHGEK